MATTARNPEMNEYEMPQQSLAHFPLHSSLGVFNWTSCSPCMFMLPIISTSHHTHTHTHER